MYKRNDSWYTDFHHEGQRYCKSWGSISKTVAAEKDQKFKTEVREGKHALKSKKILFEKFCEKYLAQARIDKQASSATRNEMSINALKFHFSGKLLSTIHPFAVEQYKKTRIEEGKTPATVNRDVSTLKNMLTKAVRWGHLKQNPLDKQVGLLREDNEVMWVLTSEEEKILLLHCGKSPQRKGAKYLRDLVLFALHSAMRLGEILNLKKCDVDMELRVVYVWNTKNKEPRRVPINDTLKSVIERRLKSSEDIEQNINNSEKTFCTIVQKETIPESQLRPLSKDLAHGPKNSPIPVSEYLFSQKNGKKLSVLSNAFWFAVKAAGLTRMDNVRGQVKMVRFRFHDLRHTAGSRLGMAGVDLKTIMEIMGHKTHKMAMRYQHPAPVHKLNAMKTLDEVPSKSPQAIIEAVKR
jgi:integrase